MEELQSEYKSLYEKKNQKEIELWDLQSEISDLEASLDEVGSSIDELKDEEYYS